MAIFIIMQRNISLSINARLLATSEESLKKVVDLLKELEDKGFIKDGKIVFDSSQDKVISEIFDRHMNP